MPASVSPPPQKKAASAALGAPPQPCDSTSNLEEPVSDSTCTSSSSSTSSVIVIEPEADLCFASLDSQWEQAHSFFVEADSSVGDLRSPQVSSTDAVSPHLSPVQFRPDTPSPWGDADSGFFDPPPPAQQLVNFQPIFDVSGDECLQVVMPAGSEKFAPCVLRCLVCEDLFWDLEQHSRKHFPSPDLNIPPRVHGNQVIQKRAVPKARQKFKVKCRWNACVVNFRTAEEERRHEHCSEDQTRIFFRCVFCSMPVTTFEYCMKHEDTSCQTRKMFERFGEDLNFPWS